MCQNKKHNEQKQKKNGDDSMTNVAFAEFVKNNKSKIITISSKNSKYNDEGHPVLTKDDLWREEKEWDEYFEEISKKK